LGVIRPDCKRSCDQLDGFLRAGGVNAQDAQKVEGVDIVGFLIKYLAIKPLSLWQVSLFLHLEGLFQGLQHLVHPGSLYIDSLKQKKPRKCEADSVDAGLTPLCGELA